MTTAVTNNTSTTGTANTKGTSANKGTSASDGADRFLKLLVTQMQNQDPLNPMDNAQVTSQMAQINTVTGIDKLNTTMSTMTNSMAQMQLLQGASLVGHEVLMAGNKLAVTTDGKASAGYELSSAAAQVSIEVVNAAGTVVDTVSQTGKAAGRQSFTWTPPEGTSAAGMTFRVTANNGGKAVTVNPLMREVITAVNTTNGSLNLELSNGDKVAYSEVKAIS